MKACEAFLRGIGETGLDLWTSPHHRVVQDGLLGSHLAWAPYASGQTQPVTIVSLAYRNTLQANSLSTYLIRPFAMALCPASGVQAARRSRGRRHIPGGTASALRGLGAARRPPTIPAGTALAGILPPRTRTRAARQRGLQWPSRPRATSLAADLRIETESLTEVAPMESLGDIPIVRGIIRWLKGDRCRSPGSIDHPGGGRLRANVLRDRGASKRGSRASHADTHVDALAAPVGHQDS